MIDLNSEILAAHSWGRLSVSAHPNDVELKWVMEPWAIGRYDVLMRVQKEEKLKECSIDEFAKHPYYAWYVNMLIRRGYIFERAYLASGEMYWRIRYWAEWVE